MMPQILKSAGFTKTQKSRYFENETFFFSNKKINYTSSAACCFMRKNRSVAEVTFEVSQLCKFVTNFCFVVVLMAVSGFLFSQIKFLF